VEENVTAADLPPLPEKLMADLGALYDRSIRHLVHHYW
jgi:hypothetical protein